MTLWSPCRAERSQKNPQRCSGQCSASLRARAPAMTLCNVIIQPSSPSPPPFAGRQASMSGSAPPTRAESGGLERWGKLESFEAHNIRVRGGSYLVPSYRVDTPPQSERGLLPTFSPTMEMTPHLRVRGGTYLLPSYRGDTPLQSERGHLPCPQL